MKILFYGAKNYDKQFFDLELPKYPDISITYLDTNINETTALLATGYDAICAFVNADLSAPIIKMIAEEGVKVILMRCAGYNNVDLKEAEALGLTVYHVPSYSPEAVAEHAMALAQSANRRTHKAYIKCRENNFAIQGLMGVTLLGKTAGIVGTGKIGLAMARICQGFGMKVLGVDKFPNPEGGFIQYVSLEELLRESDLISLHCPLTPESRHMINKDSISTIKKDAILVNTSRGGLIKTEDLIDSIREGYFSAVGLDVYEEEEEYVFEDLSEHVLQEDIVARLLSFPHVIISSHQGFFTKEALEAISETTLENAKAYLEKQINGNEIVSK